jgi:hypothetical protein
MRSRLLAAFALLLAACPARSPAPAPEPPPPPSEGIDAMPPESSSSDFVPGPALSPSGPLLEWLKSQGREKRIRIPVVITFANPGRFSIGSAFIGTTPGAAPADAIQLKLDGSSLGVSLVDRVRQKCADKKQMSCALWLDGIWGPRIEGDPLGSSSDSGDRHPFGIISVGDVVDPASASTAFVSP